MRQCLKRQQCFRFLTAAADEFFDLLGRFFVLRTHSPLSPIRKPASVHQNAGQRGQRDQICNVFRKAAVEDFYVPIMPVVWSHRRTSRHAGGNPPAIGALLAPTSKHVEHLFTQKRMALCTTVGVGRCSDQFAFDQAPPRKASARHRDGMSSDSLWPQFVGMSWKETLRLSTAEGQIGVIEAAFRANAKKSAARQASTFLALKATDNWYRFKDTRGGSGRIESIVWTSLAARRKARTEKHFWTDTVRHFETSFCALLASSVRGAEAN